MSTVVALASSMLAKRWSSVRSVLMSTSVPLVQLMAVATVRRGTMQSMGLVVVPLVDFGGGVARVVDLVDFWDRRDGSAVSSDMVGAGAVVTFLCCSAVSGPALAMTGYQSGKLVKGR
eukprot:g11793.t1